MKIEAKQLYLETIKRFSLRELTAVEAFKLKSACAKIISENVELNIEVLLASSKKFLEDIVTFMEFDTLEHKDISIIK